MERDRVDDDGRIVDQIRLAADLPAAAVAALADWLRTQRPELAFSAFAQIGAIGAGPRPQRSPPLALVQLLTAYLLVSGRAGRER